MVFLKKIVKKNELVKKLRIRNDQFLKNINNKNKLNFLRKNTKKISSVNKLCWKKNLSSLSKKNWFGTGRHFILFLIKSSGYNINYNNVSINSSVKSLLLKSKIIDFYKSNLSFFGYQMKKELKKRLFFRIKFLMFNNKGFRKLKGLPSNGQRTRSNGKTVKYLRFHKNKKKIGIGVNKQ